VVSSSANKLVENAFFANASREVISCVGVVWACEERVMDALGYTRAGDLWTIRLVVFTYPVEVLVDRSVACM